MKKIISLASVFISLLVLQACDSPDKAAPILAGNHPLRKMVQSREIESSLSGGFFLIVGSISGSAKETLNIKFAWKMNDGDIYAISSLPLEKIRVKLNEKAEVPTIQFNWQRREYHSEDLQYLINNYVYYAVITCKEKDWPVNIKLPLN